MTKFKTFLLLLVLGLIPFAFVSCFISKPLSLSPAIPASTASSAVTLQVTPNTTYDFGSVYEQNSSAAKTFYFTNLGTETAGGCSNSFSNTNASGVFAITADDCSSSQAANASCSLSIVATPIADSDSTTSSTVYSATLTRACGVKTASVALSVTGLDLNISLSGLALNSGAIYTSTNVVTVAYTVGGSSVPTSICFSEDNAVATCSPWRSAYSSPQLFTLSSAASSEGNKTVYAWLARNDENGGIVTTATATGTYDSLVYDTAAPTVPTISDPPDWVNATSLIVSWTGGTDNNFDHYNLRLCDGTNNCSHSSACSGVVTSTTQSNPRVYTFSAANGTTLTENHAYYVCVQTVDLAERTSAYAVSTTDVTVDALAPIAPTISNPPSILATTNLNVTWTAGTDNNLFQHQIKACTNSDCSTGCLDTSDDTSSPTGLSSLVDGNSYYLCVRSQDQSLQSSSFIASTSKVTIDTTAPTAPSAVTAPPSSWITTTTPAVTFTADAVDNNFAYYAARGCTNAACSVGCTSDSTGATSPISISLLENVSYYYCVKSVDLANNVSAYTTSASDATVDSIPPTDPSNISPDANVLYGVQGFRYTYTPTWTASTDMNLDIYQVRACTDAACSTSCTSTNDTAVIGGATISDMVYQTSYYTCVRALDLAGNSNSGGNNGFIASASTLFSYEKVFTWVWGKPAGNGYEEYTGYARPQSLTPAGMVRPWPTAGGYSNLETDSADNLFLYGGSFIGLSSSLALTSGGYLNQLWLWDSAGGHWTLLHGDLQYNKNTDSGQLGVGASSNTPGSRVHGTTWVDGNDHLWLFGGYGFGSSGSTAGALNDLWEWDGSHWIWRGGDTSINNNNYSYGTRNVADANNWPPPMSGMGRVYDPTNDTLYLFGGKYSDGQYSGNLWKYEGATGLWTWMWQGSNNYSVYNAVNTFDLLNRPGAGSLMGMGIDETQDLFIFAGNTYDSTTGPSYSNATFIYNIGLDQWNYRKGGNTINYAGVCGAQGVEDESYFPAARVGAYNSCINYQGGNLVYWLLGESYISCTGASAWRASDLWRFRQHLWSFVKGSTSSNKVAGVWGTEDVSDPANYPPSGYEGVSLACSKTAADTLYARFGRGSSFLTVADMPPQNSLWKFNGTDWTWIDGYKGMNALPAYMGAAGVADISNDIGGRVNISRNVVNYPGKTQAKVFFFGGHGVDIAGNLGLLNDLWSFDGQYFTYEGGNPAHTINNLGVYGAQGVADSGYYPGGRDNGLTWQDATGDIWVYAGNGYALGASAYLCDLHRFEYATKKWTLVKGNSTNNSVGDYSVSGSYDTTVFPRSRDIVAAAEDVSGNIWIYGGYSNGVYLNDLWVFNGADFKLVFGDNTGGNDGDWGTLGVTAASNKPSGRGGSLIWFDSTGDLYLFGGYGKNNTGVDKHLNDLWKWDGSNWTWIGGSNAGHQTAVYGTTLVPSASNWPGSAYTCNGAVDANSNLYMGCNWGCATSSGSRGYLNDLWKWHADLQQWSYQAGPKTINDWGSWSYKGIPLTGLYPASGTGGAIWWFDATGDLWIFGAGPKGLFSATSGNTGKNNAVWRFTP